MSPRARPHSLIAVAGLCAWLAAAPLSAEEPFVFSDVTVASGLDGHFTGIMNHAAAWGDIDGDGDLDLFNGNFCDRPARNYLGRDGPVPSILLINDNGRFVDSRQSVLSWLGRTSGAAFIDLDNDGDLDLYATNNSVRNIFVPNQLFENTDGRFRNVSKDNAACLKMGGRSVGVLDYNGDGRLDLLGLEDVPGRTRLFRNLGGLRFEDVTDAAGLPRRSKSLGVITPDLNLDGWPDIFVTMSNQLFLSQGDGTYRGGPEIAGVLNYRPPEGEPCGVSFGDVDRDGDMDIVIADHTKHPGARQHLFINRGLRNGIPNFLEVSKQAGLDYIFPNRGPTGLLIKSAHLELADFDNDGWLDIVIAATYNDNGKDMPFVLRNLGRGADGMIRFKPPPVSKVNAYFPSGPTGDVDRDGRIDVFLGSWFPEIRSKLFLNRSPKRHWLEVTVRGKTINRQGIGCKIRLYQTGQVGKPKALLGYEEITVSEGFCSGQEAVAHFGLGGVVVCDVEVTLPFGKGTVSRKGVRCDQRIEIREE